MPQSDPNTQAPTAADQILRWTRTLNARERRILTHRLGEPKDLQTLTHIASEMGITRERIRQLQNLMVRAFGTTQAQQTDSPAGAAVVSIAAEVGAAAPAPSVADMLAQHGLAQHTILILKTAGPYVLDRGWLIRADAVWNDPTPNILTPGDRPADAAQSFERLANWGIKPRLAMAWLNRTRQVRPIPGGLMPIAPGLNDRLVQSLTLLAQPSTPAEILARIREHRHPRTTINRLSVDPRFVRTHKRQWALAHWENEVYTSCAAKMQETLRREGPIPVDDLIEHLSDHFGLTPKTIRTHIRPPLFQINQGTISLRTPGTGTITNQRPLGTYPLPKGIFKNGHRRLTKIIEVTHDTLRGCSVSLTKTAGKILELPAHATLEYTGQNGLSISVMADPTRTTGPILRSLRVPMTAHGAEPGDHFVISLDSNKMTVRAAVVKHNAVTPGWQTLSKLTGIPVYEHRPDQDPLTPLSQALMCQPAQVRQLLTKRGDTHVVAAIPDTVSNSTPRIANWERKTGKNSEITAA